MLCTTYAVLYTNNAGVVVVAGCVGDEAGRCLKWRLTREILKED
jgi:hypothetical protein